MDDLSLLSAIVQAVLLFSLSMYPAGILFSCSECCGTPEPLAGECRCLRFERRTQPAPSVYFEDKLPVHGWSNDSISRGDSGLIPRCESISISRSFDPVFSSDVLIRPNGTLTRAQSLSDGETATTLTLELWSRYAPAGILSANPNRFPPPGTDEIILEKVTDASAVYQGTTQKISISERSLGIVYLDSNAPESTVITLKTVTKGTATVRDDGVSVNVPVSAAVVGVGLDPLYAEPSFTKYLDGSELTPQSLLAMGSVSNATQTELLANGSTRITYSATFTFNPISNLFAYVPVSTSGTTVWFGAYYLIEVTHGSVVTHFRIRVRGRNENAPTPLPADGLPAVNIPAVVVPAQPENVAGSVQDITYNGTSAIVTFKMRNSSAASYGPSPVPLDPVVYTPVGRNRMQNSFAWSTSPGVYTRFNPSTPRISLTPQACDANKLIWSAAAGPTWPSFQAVYQAQHFIGLAGDISPQGIEENFVFDYDQVDEFAAGTRALSYLSVDAGIIDVTRAPASPLCGRWPCSYAFSSAGFNNTFQNTAVPAVLDAALPSTATVSIPAGESMAYVPRLANVVGQPQPGPSCVTTANTFGLKRLGGCSMSGETTDGTEPNSAAALSVGVAAFLCGDSLWAIENGPCISQREFKNSVEDYDGSLVGSFFSPYRRFVPKGSTVSLGGELPSVSEACLSPVSSNSATSLSAWSAIGSACPAAEVTATITAEVGGFCSGDGAFDGQPLVAALNADVVMPLTYADEHTRQYNFYFSPPGTDVTFIDQVHYRIMNLNSVPCQTIASSGLTFFVGATQRKGGVLGAVRQLYLYEQFALPASCPPKAQGEGVISGTHQSFIDWPTSSTASRIDVIEGTVSFELGDPVAGGRPTVESSTTQLPAEQTEISQTLTRFTKYFLSGEEKESVFATDNGPHTRVQQVPASLFPGPTVAYIEPNDGDLRLIGQRLNTYFRAGDYLFFTKADRPAWAVNNISNYIAFFDSNPASISKEASARSYGVQNFGILSTNGMDLVSESDWISIDVALRNSSTYNKSWLVRFQANLTGEARSGSVLFTYGEFSERWVINQSA